MRPRHRDENGTRIVKFYLHLSKYFGSLGTEVYTGKQTPRGPSARGSVLGGPDANATKIRTPDSTAYLLLSRVRLNLPPPRHAIRRRRCRSSMAELAFVMGLSLRFISRR